MNRLVLTIAAISLISSAAFAQGRTTQSNVGTRRSFQSPYSRLTQVPFDIGRRDGTQSPTKTIKGGVHISTSSAGGVHVATGSGGRHGNGTRSHIRTRGAFPVGYRGINQLGVPFIVTGNGVVLLGGVNGIPGWPGVDRDRLPLKDVAAPAPSDTTPADKKKSVAETKTKKVVRPMVLEPMKHNVWKNFETAK